MSALELVGDVWPTNTGLSATLSESFKLHVDVLEPWLCRVAITPEAGLRVPHTWMIAPDGDVPWEGRKVLASDGFSCPEVKLDASQALLQSDSLRVQLQAEPLALTVQRKIAGQWQTCFADRPMAAYRHLTQRGQMHHAQLLDQKHRHLGLGDKSGALDRTGRRFRCLQTDALGYNAETSDPLYKHVPWIMYGNQQDGFTGLFYDSFAEINIDLGAEHSNYHPHYRQTEVFDNALVYYLFTSPTIKELVTQFQGVTGKPHFQPRWALGFAHTSMHLADAETAQHAIQGFAEEARRREFPISAIHSGSGYTTRDDGRRYVFTWNKKKFPDRAAFFKALSNMGFHSCANIKPVLLKEHPLFDEVAEFEGFINSEKNEPALEMFWGGLGASLDFTNPKTIKWWQNGVLEQVIGAGFSSVWNDNNECEIWDEGARLNGFGEGLRAMDVRPVQALLMTRASFEASCESNPEQRPYTITRAGPVGISRYAQTWSGDNKTSWHTLHWNLANGLNMSLSGFPLTGHDIGGFDGPTPSAELLCRWVEMMSLHPRAVMNSWKPDAEIPLTTPWMHEAVTSKIKAALHLRYQLLPWLYHLSWRAHTSGEPVITPLCYHFNDAACEHEQSQFMLGDHLMVSPVTEPAETTRNVYLPEIPQGWYTWKPGAEVRWYAGAQVVTLDAPLGEFPVCVAVGAILPIAQSWPVESPHNADNVAITVFPGKTTGSSEQTVFFDDGVSWSHQDNHASLVHVNLHWDEKQVVVLITEKWTGEGRPQLSCEVAGLDGRQLTIELPESST